MDAYSALKEDDDFVANEPPEYELRYEPESSDQDPRFPGFVPKSYQGTRPIFSNHQVLRPGQISRGDLLLAQDVFSGNSLLVVLHGSVSGGSAPHIRVRDLITREVSKIYLSDYSVCPYEGGTWATHRYLVDTGKRV